MKPELETIRFANGIRIYYDRLKKYGEIAPNVVLKGTPKLKGILDTWGLTLQQYDIPVKYILTGGLYVKRNQRGSNRLSKHALGIAIDVDGVIFEDERKFMTTDAEKDWPTYLAIEATLRMRFGVVLNRDYNRLHNDHWHCDLSRSVEFSERSRSQTLFIQRAIREFWDGNLKVDGRFGPKTRAAMDSICGDWSGFLKIVAGQLSQESEH